jgi:predicted ArsR family transcriptional regulator
MLLPVFRDLIKPQWLAVIELLKKHGALPVSEIASHTGASYMATKAHCDQLAECGYLHRARLPRTEVGRPEIFYSLSAKADALFPQAGAAFALDLLEELRAMHGESAPERMLFQMFAKTAAAWGRPLESYASCHEKARKLAEMRNKEGYASAYVQDSSGDGNIVEHHSPLQWIFDRYPRCIAMEQRMIEKLLGCPVTRSESARGPESAPVIVFKLS